MVATVVVVIAVAAVIGIVLIFFLPFLTRSGRTNKHISQRANRCMCVCATAVFQCVNTISANVCVNL